MKILVACEYSGVVREAFRKRGHEAMSCDILPTEIPGPHYQGDVFDILGDGWDLMVAHPPCTYLANSGVRWRVEREEWSEIEEAANFFNKLLEAPINKICVENPIQHKYARQAINSAYSQIVQPYMFGHMESKATCLWLKNLPGLVETDNVKEEMKKLDVKERMRIWYQSPGPDRQKIRSKTYQGIANAMAEQWG